jgi:hypothetical protein
VAFRGVDGKDVKNEGLYAVKDGLLVDEELPEQAQVLAI